MKKIIILLLMFIISIPFVISVDSENSGNLSFGVVSDVTTSTVSSPTVSSGGGAATSSVTSDFSVSPELLF
ncbi:MAG: hypothetical protein QT09_C0014G0006 [archaeon GW2011_AR18]|nr:MAG: hypothetical protein QT09_C0014G0006 [archaeon GW2011_AR18]